MVVYDEPNIMGSSIIQKTQYYSVSYPSYGSHFCIKRKILD